MTALPASLGHLEVTVLPQGKLYGGEGDGVNNDGNDLCGDHQYLPWTVRVARLGMTGPPPATKVQLT